VKTGSRFIVDPYAAMGIKEGGPMTPEQKKIADRMYHSMVLGEIKTPPNLFPNRWGTIGRECLPATSQLRRWRSSEKLAKTSSFRDVPRGPALRKN
jgi:hypothetical protein